MGGCQRIVIVHVSHHQCVGSFVVFGEEKSRRSTLSQPSYSCAHVEHDTPFTFYWSLGCSVATLSSPTTTTASANAARAL